MYDPAEYEKYFTRISYYSMPYFRILFHIEEEKKLLI